MTIIDKFVDWAMSDQAKLRELEIRDANWERDLRDNDPAAFARRCSLVTKHVYEAPSGPFGRRRKRTVYMKNGRCVTDATGERYLCDAGGRPLGGDPAVIVVEHAYAFPEERA